MAFLYKAFIRKNTPELRAKLEDLGYTNGAWESPRFHYPYLSVWPNPKFGLFKGEGFYMTEDDYRFNGKVWEYKPKEDVIDCGDNEELFLAIAALRDDKTPDYQWYVWDDNEDKGEKFKQYIPGEHWPGWWWFEVHKATVEELIEHFN
jgi:hypothetical protein